jgi:hypothetical protein
MVMSNLQLVSAEGGKPENPEKKPLKEGREPMTNVLTHSASVS